MFANFTHKLEETDKRHINKIALMPQISRVLKVVLTSLINKDSATFRLKVLFLKLLSIILKSSILGYLWHFSIAWFTKCDLVSPPSCSSTLSANLRVVSPV